MAVNKESSSEILLFCYLRMCNVQFSHCSQTPLWPLPWCRFPHYTRAPGCPCEEILQDGHCCSGAGGAALCVPLAPTQTQLLKTADEGAMIQNDTGIIQTFWTVPTLPTTADSVSRVIG